MPLDSIALSTSQCINLIRFLKEKALEHLSIDASALERHMGFRIEINSADGDVFFDSGSRKLLEAIRAYLVRQSSFNEKDFIIEYEEKRSINGMTKDDSSASLVIDFNTLRAIWDKMKLKGLREVYLDAGEIEKERRGYEKTAVLDQSTDKGQCLQLIDCIKSKLTENAAEGEKYPSHMGFQVHFRDDNIMFQSDSAKLLTDIYQYFMDYKLLNEGECELQGLVPDKADLEQPGTLFIGREHFPKLWDSLQLTFVNIEKAQCLQLIKFIEVKLSKVAESALPSNEVQNGFDIEMYESTVTFQAGSASVLQDIMSYLEDNGLIYKGKYQVTTLPSQTEDVPPGSVDMARADLPALWQQLINIGLGEALIKTDIGNEAERYAVSRKQFGEKQTLFQSQVAADQKLTQKIIGSLKAKVECFDKSCQSRSDIADLQFDDDRLTYDSGYESMIYGSNEQNYKSTWAIQNAPRYHGKKAPPLDGYETIRYAQEALILDYYCTQYVCKNGDSGIKKKQISNELIQRREFKKIRENPTLCALSVHYLQLKRELEKQKTSQSPGRENFSVDEVDKRKLLKKLQANVGQMCWDLIKAIDEAPSTDDASIKEKEAELTEIYKLYKTFESSNYRVVFDEFSQVQPQQT